MIAIHEIGGGDTALGTRACQAVVAWLEQSGVKAMHVPIGKELDFNSCLGVTAFESDGGLFVSIDSSLTKPQYSCALSNAQWSDVPQWIEDVLPAISRIVANSKT